MKGWSPEHGSLDLTTIRRLYADHRLNPTDLVDVLLRRIAPLSGENIFITVMEQELRAAARALEARPHNGSRPPLWGIPFAIKDNIDVAGVPTTAGCPAFSHIPTRTAPVVEHLVAAGALLVGKTNMDQFATGLTGVLSGFGVCRNPFDRSYVSGGSSSGSAAAVSRGLASFALGTDTAGSGRVPAGFCNVVGFKPSRGLVSTRGILPACRSLDCTSVFGLTAPDAACVLDVIKGYDREDIFSKPSAAELDLRSLPLPLKSFRFGVPAREFLDFLGDSEAERLFDEALDRLSALGGRRVEIDFTPFQEAARLLYEGPWLAERLAGLEEFLAAHEVDVHPVTRSIIMSAGRIRAVEAFKALYELETLKRRAAEQCALADVLALPTTPSILTVEAAQRDPAAASAALGRYTNFVNLLDLCAIALPAGFRRNGLPFGITLIAPAMQDARVLYIGTRYQTAAGGTLGATGIAASSVLQEGLAESPVSAPAEEPKLRICVVGAHLSGMPLNHQLTARGATLALRCRTAPLYRLYALPGTTPPKPGLVRESRGTTLGRGIDVEVWNLPLSEVGSFFKDVAAPLCIGNIALDSGDTVAGFLCEAYAVADATDITDFGGWRAYTASLRRLREKAETGAP